MCEHPFLVVLAIVVEVGALWVTWEVAWWNGHTRGTEEGERAVRATVQRFLSS